jgi:hypothetical protein
MSTPIITINGHASPLRLIPVDHRGQPIERIIPLYRARWAREPSLQQAPGRVDRECGEQQHGGAR